MQTLCMQVKPVLALVAFLAMHGLSVAEVGLDTPLSVLFLESQLNPESARDVHDSFGQ